MAKKGHSTARRSPPRSSAASSSPPPPTEKRNREGCPINLKQHECYAIQSNLLLREKQKKATHIYIDRERYNLQDLNRRIRRATKAQVEAKESIYDAASDTFSLRAVIVTISISPLTIAHTATNPTARACFTCRPRTRKYREHRRLPEINQPRPPPPRDCHETLALPRHSVHKPDTSRHLARGGPENTTAAGRGS
jgi:hypothetical protein